MTPMNRHQEGTVLLDSKSLVNFNKMKFVLNISSSGRPDKVVSRYRNAHDPLTQYWRCGSNRNKENLWESDERSAQALL